jgi:peroxisomal membrane protein 4
MIVLRNVNPAAVGKEGKYDSFFAGLLGGYAVFGRHKSSITQQVCWRDYIRDIKETCLLTYWQIVIYIFARVVLGFAKLSIQPGAHPFSSLIGPEARKQIEGNAWAVFASLSWAFVMYLFRWHPETLMSSLRSSMVYMYAQFTSS